MKSIPSCKIALQVCLYGLLLAFVEYNSERFPVEHIFLFIDRQVQKKILTFFLHLPEPQAQFISRQKLSIAVE